MQEALLHYIWQYQKFSSSKLYTTDRSALVITRVGTPNLRSGPDFLDAQLYFDALTWSGPVEIHVKSSDWYRHAHQLDSNYDNVILHVVWEHDTDIIYSSGKKIPTLQLKDFVDKNTLELYKKQFSKSPKALACESEIHQFSHFQWHQWLERLFVERIEERVRGIHTLLVSFKNDWEEVLYLLLFKAYGLNINGDAFFESAKLTPFRIVRKLADKPLDMEALFMGQVGLLNTDSTDLYLLELKKRYAYLRVKFTALKFGVLRVQFARLRPSNFPTVRVAQLAALYAKRTQLFQEIIQQEDPEQCFDTFQVSLSEYWKTHYNFGTESRFRIKKISRSFFNLILINVILPLRFAYSRYLGESGEDALFRWVQHIPKEKNRIIEIFDQFKVPIKCAGDSQAILHLYKNYCKVKHCLSCNVGFHLMKG